MNWLHLTSIIIRSANNSYNDCKLKNEQPNIYQVNKIRGKLINHRLFRKNILTNGFLTKMHEKTEGERKYDVNDYCSVREIAKEINIDPDKLIHFTKDLLGFKSNGRPLGKTELCLFWRIETYDNIKPIYVWFGKTTERNPALLKEFATLYKSFIIDYKAFIENYK